MAATNRDSFNNPQEDGCQSTIKLIREYFVFRFLKDALHLIVGGLAHHSKSIFPCMYKNIGLQLIIKHHEYIT